MGTERRMLIGEKFGKLRVLAAGPDIQKKARCYPTSLCQCDCGKRVVVQNRLLLSGMTRSCGCLRKESAREREKRNPRKLQVLEKGRRFGKLIIEGEAQPVYRKDGRRIPRSVVRCLCGNSNLFIVRNDTLLSGLTKSCGCMRVENARAVLKNKPIYESLPYGFSKSRLYTIFVGMHKRCENPSHHAYQQYGGRGIEVCKEWATFSGFRQWALSHGYEDGLTIDRIDNNGEYSPQNCRWVTMLCNARNKPTVKKIMYDGECLFVSDIAKRIGLSRCGVWQRLKSGWSIEEILTTVSHKGNNRAQGRMRKAG